MAKKLTQPHLFTPLKIKDLTFKNRMGVSPMDIFEAKDGQPSEIHFVQYGKYVLEGYGFIIFEAAAVEPRGRITPNDCGIWDDSFIPSYKKITDFAHQHDTRIGIQLNHAGRKASSIPPSKIKKKFYYAPNEISLYKYI